MPPLRLLLVAIALGAGGSFHFGYQVSSPNPSVNSFRRFLNVSYSTHYGHSLNEETYRALWSFVLVVQPVGMLVGYLIVRPAAEKLGRKRSLILSAFLIAVGLLLQIASSWLNSFETLAVGRFVVGVGMALMTGVQAMYLSEISPKQYRGAVGGTTGLFMELGFSIGAAAGLPDLLGSDSTWQYLYVVELAMSIVAWTVLFFIPESPKYLVANGERTAAMEALRFFRHADPSSVMLEIEDEVRFQSKRVSVADIIRKPHLRKGVLLGFGCLVTTTCSGILPYSYFSTQLLVDVGLSSKVAEYASVAIMSMCFFAAIVSSSIIDRAGRRPLLLATIAIMALCNVLLMMFSILYNRYNLPWLGHVSVASCIVFMITFGMGPSVVPFVINAEMVPQNARATAQSFTYTTNRVLTVILTMAFFPLDGAIGGYSLLLYIVPLPILFVIFFVYLPETKNRTALEIMQSLGYRPGEPNVTLSPAKPKSSDVHETIT